jgi:hypothetical protein
LRKHLEVEIMNKLFELIFWLKIFLSPFVLLNVIGFIIYLSDDNLWWVWVALGVLGSVLGIYWAEHVRKKHGTTEFMAQVFQANDIKSYDEIVGGEE